MLERNVEDALIRGAKSRGAWPIKSERLVRGFPDRMLLASHGRVAFVELKRLDQKLRPAQCLMRKFLRRLGFLVVKLDTIEEVEEFLHEWLD